MPLPPNETAPLVSVTHAAARMGVSRATAYRLVTKGELPAVKVGAQLRIDPVELHEYIYGRRRTEASAT
jgi:excisionase family DNA binding protein